MGAAFNLLAIDSAGIVGWAYIDAAAAPVRLPQPKSGIEQLPEGVSLGHYLHHFREWLLKMIDANAIRGVVYETPVIIPRKTTLPKALKLCSLAGEIELVCYEKEILFLRNASAQTVREYFCGDRHAGKTGVMAKCTSLGWTFKTDDEADALATLIYGVDRWKKEWPRGL